MGIGGGLSYGSMIEAKYRRGVYRLSPIASTVESECGAVAVGPTYLFPPLSSGGASLVRPWLRFHMGRGGRSRPNGDGDLRSRRNPQYRAEGAPKLFESRGIDKVS